jgi:hypothetical protein
LSPPGHERLASRTRARSSGANTARIQRTRRRKSSTTSRSRPIHEGCQKVTPHRSVGARADRRPPAPAESQHRTFGSSIGQDERRALGRTVTTVLGVHADELDTADTGDRVPSGPVHRGALPDPRGTHRPVPAPPHDPQPLEHHGPRLTTDTVESPLPRDWHGGFGERPGETGQRQRSHRAPGRLDSAPRPRWRPARARSRRARSQQRS